MAYPNHFQYSSQAQPPYQENHYQPEPYSQHPPFPQQAPFTPQDSFAQQESFPQPNSFSQQEPYPQQFQQTPYTQSASFPQPNTNQYLEHSPQTQQQQLQYPQPSHGSYSQTPQQTEFPQPTSQPQFHQQTQNQYPQQTQPNQFPPPTPQPQPNPYPQQTQQAQTNHYLQQNQPTQFLQPNHPQPNQFTQQQQTQSNQYPQPAQQAQQNRFPQTAQQSQRSQHPQQNQQISRSLPQQQQAPQPQQTQSSQPVAGTYELFFTGRDDPRCCMIIGEDTKPVYFSLETQESNLNQTLRTLVYKNDRELCGKLEWGTGTYLGNAILGNRQFPMSHFVLPGSTENARRFVSADGKHFEWRRCREGATAYDLYMAPNVRIALFRKYNQPTAIGPSHGLIQYTFSNDILLVEALLSLLLNRWIDLNGIQYST